ncbi:MAG: DUF975 family protein [Clostridiales bacterium]|nr:DUF975 family protein [Clostridiales bacterium]
MQKNRPSAELKRLAKGQLLGNYGGYIAAEMIYSLITVTLSMIILVSVDLYSITGIVIYYAILFLVQVLCSLFVAGFIRMYLQTIKTGNYSFTDLFYAFRHHTDKIIVIGFILSLIRFTLQLPHLLLSWSFLRTGSFSFLFADLILLTIFNVLAIYINITFSQAYYIALDFPECTAIEALKMSHRFMKGHKGRYFYISMSFLPLMLLCLCTCGIGYLWLGPYIGMTFANFYMDLMQSKREEQNMCPPVV